MCYLSKLKFSFESKYNGLENKKNVSLYFKPLLESNFYKLQEELNNSKNSSYEPGLRRILNLKAPAKELERICDAICPRTSELIEFKKGKFWVDTVRLSEQYLKSPFQEVSWIHFDVSKPQKRLNSIIYFKLSKLIEMIGITKELAYIHIDWYNQSKKMDFVIIINCQLKYLS